MPDLSVICTLWVGEWEGLGGPDHQRIYGPEYISRLKDMVSKKLSYDFDFVCLSNLLQEDFRDDITVIPLERGWPAWWSKIEMFNPDLPLNERILSLDIDILVVGNLDAVVDYKGPFSINNYWSFSGFKSAGVARRQARKNRGKRLVPLYSSDVIVFDKGARPELYHDFKDEYIDVLCGDQDWIGKRLPKERMLPKGWGRKLKNSDKGYDPIEPGDVKTIACHPVKNHMLEKKGYIWADNFWKGKE